jgi:hypothetical protein
MNNGKPRVRRVVLSSAEDAVAVLAIYKCCADTIKLPGVKLERKSPTREH